MKKFIFFAVVSMVFVTCSKTDKYVPEPQDTDSFEKGEVVTLSTDSPEMTKAYGEYADSTIQFKWNDDDSIKVFVGEDSAKFKVSALRNGGKSAKFVGSMPKNGKVFRVEYPYGKRDLKDQKYDSNKKVIPNEMMFASTGTSDTCHKTIPFHLAPQNAVLHLKIKKGIANETNGQSFKKIYTIITTINEDNYNLSIDEGCELNSTTETDFFIIVKPTQTVGSSLSVCLKGSDGNSILTKKSSSSVVFTQGTIKRAEIEVPSDSLIVVKNEPQNDGLLSAH